MNAYVFDTETSGLTEPRIIEAAWIKVSNPADLIREGDFCQRYNPGKPIELGALATHHIMDEELAACEPYTNFKLPDDTAYIIGHNVDFDWKVIGEPNVKRICTLALSRSLFSNLDSHNQSAMVYHFFRAQARYLLKNAHSALQDVENCLLILRPILDVLFKQRVEPTWEAIWQASEKARIPKVMAFGNHKGMAIAELPTDYKMWLLRQQDIDPYLIKALKGHAA